MNLEARLDERKEQLDAVLKTIVMAANDGLTPEELDNIVQVMFIEFDYDFLKLMMSFLLFCYIERIFALEQEAQNELLH